MEFPGLTVEVRKAKAVPIVASLCKDLQIASTIDRYVRWDPDRTKVSPGTSPTFGVIGEKSLF